MNCNDSIRRTRAIGIRLAIWIGLAIIAAGCSDCEQSTVDQPTVDATIREPYCIEITGSDYRWHVRYPDGDGQIAEQGSGPIVRDIHVPCQTDVVFVLTSNDYVYTLALPQYGLKEIAVPKLEFRMEFHPLVAGRFPLEGDELCGDPHPNLQGELIVEPRDRFMKWLADQKQVHDNPKLSDRGTKP